MSWNYRVVRRMIGNMDTFQIHEVYYREDGAIHTFTEDPVGAFGESLEELKRDLRWMLEACDKEVLDYEVLSGMVEKGGKAWDS